MKAEKLSALLALLFCTALTVLAQNARTVRGTVNDGDGLGIPGAVVMLQGAGNVAATTTTNGEYSLSIPSSVADPRIEVSCLGFVSAVESVDGRSVVNFVLSEDSQILDEVVVVGYGLQKKVNVTGAVTAIDFEKTMENRTIVSTSAALAGLAPGMSVMQSSGQPGSDGATIRIRGNGSFSSGAGSPLVLVDGIEWSMDNVNPADIENISVLKDAASTAIYGTRASNGIILITTRKGSESKTRVNYSFKGIIQNPYNELAFVSDYAEHMSLINESCDNIGTSRIFSQNSIDTWLAAKADPTGVNAYGVPNSVAYPNTDWFDEIFETGFSQEHSLSVSGGSRKIHYLMSYGYLDNQGVMNRFDINSSSQKHNFRTNVEADVTPWLTFGTRIFGQRQLYGLANISNAFSYLYQTTPGVYPGSPNAWGRPALNGEESSNANNILHQMYGSKGYNQTSRLNGSLYAKARPLKGLSLEATFNYSPVWTEKATHSSGMNGFWDYVTDTRYSSPSLDTATSSESLSRNYRTSVETLARYEITLGSHAVGALLGYSNQKYESWGFNASRTGATDWSLSDMSTYLGGYEQDPETMAVTMKESIGATARSGNAQQSVFGRINYAYADKYLFEADFRYDGSSKFGPGYKYGFFPAFSAGWKIAEEPFMESTRSWLDNLKLRLSYGSGGNNNALGNYTWQATYVIGGAVLDGTGTKVLYSNSMSNNLLHWEKSSTADLGLDAGFFGNRLTMEFDIYDKKTSDILYTPAIYYTMGQRSGVPANLGNLSNRGVELTLGWRSSIGKDFQYYAKVNASYNINKVTRFKGKLVKGMVDGKYVNNISDVAENFGNGRLCEGHALGEHYLYSVYHGNGTGYNGGAVDVNAGPKDGMIRTEKDMEWVEAMLLSGYKFYGNSRLAKNQFWYGDLIYADHDGDGNYGDTDDMDFNGHTDTPSALLGINLGFSWKGFDFSMTWSGAFGFWINWNAQYYNGSTLTNGYGISKRVAGDHYFYDSSNPDDPRTNLTGTYPRLTYGDNLANRLASDFYEYKGDFMKLKNIQLGYTLPGNLTRKFAVQQLRFFASGENLLTITSYPGLDPEKGSTIGYPLMRQVTLGAQITF